MATTTTPTGAGGPFAPAIPQSVEELDIPQSIVIDLFLRKVMLEGFSTLYGLHQSLRLSMPIVDAAFKHLRQQQWLDVKGMVGNDYHFTLTNAGKQIASDRFQICHYAGACPVSIGQYAEATKAQSARVTIDRQSLKQAYSDLVVTDHMLDQLGPALVSQTSLFLYGPSGNGKTSFAERMLRIYSDSILIPYSVEVDGQIINLYDPVVHNAVEANEPEIDPRWIRIKRPCISVGGELVANMLDLRLDGGSGIYAAPLQMKANNGIFLIDDFGRQLMSPRDLLNRWIVPLDRRVDYLALSYGVKFQIPFEMLVVFSTNLDPSELADEAFLRRIQNKIEVEPVSPEVFDEIFHRVVAQRGLNADYESAAYLRKLCLDGGRTELRACYPLDMVNIIHSISHYEKRPPAINRDNLERAVNLYFAKI